MGERKVLNKYYPADFDPSKLPRRKQPKNQQVKVRMMLPMSMRCSTCANYVYQGTKFNSRKELVAGEKYLDIAIFRFYFKCPRCTAEITFKTDPKNSDYTVESGATRNHEPRRRAENETKDRMKKERDIEEMGNPMKSLENRTVESKREMDNIADLHELSSLKSRHEKLKFDDVLDAALKEGKKITQDELDRAIVKSIYSKANVIKRIRIPDDEDEDTRSTKRVKSCLEELTQKTVSRTCPKHIRFISKPKKKTTDEDTALKLLCQNYKDDEDT